jgi:hypothetical protein
MIGRQSQVFPAKDAISAADGAAIHWCGEESRRDPQLSCSGA